MSEPKEVTPITQIGKTPAGSVAAETPIAIQPSMRSMYGPMYALLGAPRDRYGRLHDARIISTEIKVKMLTDPVIAFCLAYIGSKLVKAKYEIRCAVPQVRKFFEVMYEGFHSEFMLQAAMAVALGSIGLIKKFEFARPEPKDPAEPSPWTSDVTPFILKGFEQTWPIGASPSFNEKTREFTGFSYQGGDVDRVYALWLTIGKARAFGRYAGLGLLSTAYKSWWFGEFSDDQFAIYLQKSIDKMLIAGYPPGKDEHGVSNQAAALAMGDAARSGATIALPTTMYKETDKTSGLEVTSSIKKWTLDILEGTDRVMTFLQNADHFDAKKSLAMLLPYQVYMQVKQSALGGPTTAEVLGKLAVDVIVGYAVEIDRHFNEYVLPFLARVNFGAQAPRVVKVTTGLNESDRQEIYELIKTLVAQVNSPANVALDTDSMLNSLGLPILEESARRDVEEPPSPGPDSDTAAAVGADQVVPVSPNYHPDKNPSRQALEKMLSELPGYGELMDMAEITEDDLEHIAGLMEDIPGLDTLDIVELVTED